MWNLSSLDIQPLPLFLPDNEYKRVWLDSWADCSVLHSGAIIQSQALAQDSLGWNLGLVPVVAWEMESLAEKLL